MTQNLGQKPDHIKALTSLRFFAALVVVIFHFSGSLPHIPGLGVVARLGRPSVGFFFILSGFVLSYRYYLEFSQGLNWGQYRQFLFARIARIYPMYLVALLLITPVTLYELSMSPASAGPSSVLTIRSWLANAVLVQVYSADPTYQQMWNAPAWSLANEAMFYVCFPPFVAYLLGKIKRSASLVRLGAMLIAVEVAVFVLKFTYSTPFWDRSPFLRVWEFLLGCVLGALYVRAVRGIDVAPLINRLKAQRRRNLAILLAFAGSGLVTLIPTNIGAFPAEVVRWWVGYSVFFAAIILAQACGASFLSPVLEHSVFVLLGEASYSLYITHWIFLQLLHDLALKGVPVTPLWYAGAIVVTIGASIVFYKVVEVPSRRWLLATARRRPHTTAA